MLKRSLSIRMDSNIGFLGSGVILDLSVHRSCWKCGYWFFKERLIQFCSVQIWLRYTSKIKIYAGSQAILRGLWGCPRWHISQVNVKLIWTKTISNCDGCVNQSFTPLVDSEPTLMGSRQNGRTWLGTVSGCIT